MKKTALFALAISTMLLAVSCGKNGKEAETAADTGRQDSISQAAQIADKAMQDSLQRLDSIKNIVTPDMAIFDVKGPVKRISWGGGCVADFDAHGKLTSMKYKRTKYSIKRNHEGYITLCDAWYQEGPAAGGQIGGSYTYDNQHRVASFTAELGTEGNWREVETYTYDAQGHVTKVTSTEKNLDWDTEKWTSGERSSRNCSYSGEDEYGNWLNASVRYGIYQWYPDNQRVTRHIDYYAPNEI